MTAKEFLEVKGYYDPESLERLGTLLDEFLTINNVKKIDVSRTFENRPEHDYKGEQVRTFEGEQAKEGKDA